MRIVMTILRFKPAIGGGEEHVFQLSKRLVDRGHDVIVYTSDLETHYPRISYLNRETIRQRYYRGVQVRRFHASSTFKRYPSLKGYFRELMKENCDLIHAHGFGYFTSDCSALISTVRRIPLVLTTHGFFPVTRPTHPALDSLYVAMSRNWVLKVSKKILSISDSDARQFRRLVAPQKVTVIRNAVDTKFWSEPGSRVTRFCDESGPIIGAVGRVTSAKGFQLLIKATPSILREMPNAKVSIVGKDFGYLPELERLTEEIGVSHSVSFLGELSDEQLKEFYRVCSLIVVPSLHEAFGIVALEAMASGTPLVASDMGGLAEIIKDGTNGLLFKSGDSNALADAVISLLKHPEMAEMIGRNNERDSMKYSWDRTAELVEKEYLNLLHHK
jgi:glycosyltransferase involved in cell wall biosynthesis